MNLERSRSVSAGRSEPPREPWRVADPAGRLVGVTPESIGRTVCDAYDHFASLPAERRTPAAWDDLVRRLHDQLVSPAPARGVAGLLWIVRVEARFPYVNLAGEVLLRFAPPCSAPLDEVIDLVQDSFTSSAHKTAEWLRAALGEEALVEALRARAATGEWSGEAHRRVTAFLFALGLGPEVLGRSGS